MAIRVLEETGLLPHLNPGVMSWSELSRLKPVAPSMGMMLETTSRRLFETKGLAHYGSPDKDPAVRLRTLTDAGRLSIPFTTGLLVGIGETLVERAETLHAIRKSHKEFGHVQEVIVQNFRAKPDTAMRAAPDAGFDDFVATVAVARLVLGPKMRIQAPPNLVSRSECLALIGAGVDDWGGVSPLTPDHVNPERPWPALDELAAVTAEAGFELVQRLTAHPPYVLAGAAWIDPRVRGHVAALADPATGFARDVNPVGRPWQEPDAALESSGRVDLNAAIDTEGRLSAARSDLGSAFGDWESVREKVAELAARAPERVDADVLAALRSAERDPAGCSDAEYLALATADGPGLDAVAAFANSLRRDVVGDDVTFVVNRNINFTNICYTGCRFCAFAQRKGDADAYTLSYDEVGERAWQAYVDGATEVCMQGGIDPELPATGYADLVRAVKKRVPSMHVHAFSPMEIVNGAAKSGLSIRDWLIGLREAGLDTIPGTAAEILDDEVRWVLTKGKLPTSAWIEVVTTAHEVGLRSSSTMMYGHVDAPRHWIGHLRILRDIQDRTGGFTEFVPLPFVHQSSPLYLAGGARPGPTHRDNRAVHALARIMLHGRISHIQTSWVKLGVERHTGDAQRRRQRPRRHADGGDDLADGRLRVRIGKDRRRAGGDRRRHRPTRTSTNDDLPARRLTASARVCSSTRRISPAVCARSRGVSAAQLPVDTRDEVPCPVPHILEDDRDDYPANIHQRRLTRAVSAHGLGAAVPVESLVLDRHPLIRPCEVHTPYFPVSVDDLVLQLRNREAAVDHRQPSLALHRGLGPFVGERQQLANRDDASAAGLLDGRAP